MNKREQINKEFDYFDAEKQDLGEMLSNIGVALPDSSGSVNSSYEKKNDGEFNVGIEKYNEIIKTDNLPNANYIATPSAIREIMGIKREYGVYPLEKLIVDFDECQVSQKISEGRIYLISTFSDSVVEGLGHEPNMEKYILANYEDEDVLKDIKGFVEVKTNSPLETDIISICDLDKQTQKKINNLKYGGSTHDLWEPFDHAWEDEHARD